MDNANNTATETLTTVKIGRRTFKVGQTVRRTAAYLRGCKDRALGQSATDRGVIESIDIHTAYGITETRIWVRWTVGNLVGQTTQAPKGIIGA